jgi:hypothetical protein
MTVFADLQTLLEGLGFKVFSVKKLDSVNQAIVYRSISQKMIGSMSGQVGLKVERIQLSHYSIKESTLKTMVLATERALGYYDSSSFTAIPLDSKIEGFDTSTSTFYSFRDYFLIYKET